MSKFKVGDVVTCNRPVETMLRYRGVSAKVILVEEGVIKLGEPFDHRGYYTPEQFDLAKPKGMFNK